MTVKNFEYRSMIFSRTKSNEFIDALFFLVFSNERREFICLIDRPILIDFLIDLYDR